jgi:hypothetical protein
MNDYWTENGLIKPDSIVVCAANKHRESGRIICGPRHWDKTMRSQKLETETFKGWDQGFVNQFGEFLTREEAWDVAVKQNQIRHYCYGGQTGYLYSENLY